MLEVDEILYSSSSGEHKNCMQVYFCSLVWFGFCIFQGADKSKLFREFHVNFPVEKFGLANQQFLGYEIF